MNLNQLANTALLGTHRSALPVVSDKSPVKGVLEQLKDASAESKLLSLAGTLSLYEQAGVAPLKLKRVVDDLPTQDVPRCPASAVKLLNRMLGGQHSELLSEFLTLLARATYRVPEETVPLLLDRAKNVYHIRAPLMTALGDTGKWLASQNPAWYFASQLTFESASVDWKSNVMLARQGILKQARASDAKLGLELAVSTWKNDSPTDRAWIIKVLQINLNLADEPFLETALDDRSFTVRKSAAELLSSLPESRLSKRMVAVAKTMFEVRDNELFVNFPEITPQLMRDGVGRPLWSDAEKVLASQLNDIVGLLPLFFWTERFSLSPEEVIQAMRSSIWSKSLLGGLVNAIERQVNNDWAFALLKTEGYTAQTMKVLSTLNLETADKFIWYLQSKANHESDTVLLKLLSRWLQPWSLVMCEGFLGKMNAYAQQPDAKQADITLESTFKTFARHCPQTFVSQAISQLTELSQYEVFKKGCLEPLLIVNFRKRMIQDLRLKIED
jgi:hypothetical protein